MPGRPRLGPLVPGQSPRVLFRSPARIARDDSPLGLPGVSPGHRGPAGAGVSGWEPAARPAPSVMRSAAAPGAPHEIRHHPLTLFSPATFPPRPGGARSRGRTRAKRRRRARSRDKPQRRARAQTGGWGAPQSRLRSPRRPRHRSGYGRAVTVAAGLWGGCRVRREETPRGVTGIGGRGLRGRMPGAGAGSGREARGAGRAGRAGPARCEPLGDPGPSYRRAATILEAGWRRLRAVAAPAFGIAAGPAFALAGLHLRVLRRFDVALASRSPCASLRTRRRPKSGAAAWRGPGIDPRHAPVFREPWTDREIGRMVSCRVE